MKITPWETMGIIGLKLDDKIREEIDAADPLIADITYPNFNVYYEVGFCIGRNKPAIPTLNFASASANTNTSLTGLLDTVGQIRYQNGKQLADAISNAEVDAWANHYVKAKNHNEPLFILDMLREIDFQQFIISAVAHAGVESRIFYPAETPQIGLTTAVGEISSSTDIIIPLLSTEIDDSLRDNQRAAFLSGLAHGFGVDPLIVQFNDAPAPLDFRDGVTTVRSRLETEHAVEAYCQKTLVLNQSRKANFHRRRGSLLECVDLGASAAEKEQQRLGYYFVRTAEYFARPKGRRRISSGAERIREIRHFL